MFLLKSHNDDYDTDIDNMSRETDIEYIIMKYNYRGFEESSDEESSDKDTAIDYYAVSRTHFLAPTSWTPVLTTSQFNSKQVFQLHLQSNNAMPAIFFPYNVILYHGFHKTAITVV